MKSAVVVFPGINRETDMMLALEKVTGHKPVSVWHTETDLPKVDLVVVPGGFSYGDYLRSGAIARFAPVMAAVAEFAKRGGPVLGICNGFQILLEVGLLPGAMLMNRTLRFICREVHLRVERNDVAMLSHYARGQVLGLPIAHKEGNWFAEPDVADWLESQGAVALRYCSADGEFDDDVNPNGALHAIAGLVNRDGNVLGLMPHPERRVDALLGGVDGRGLLRGLVEAA
jgi:phosphoribosylformylglycinamidine synthase